MNEISRDYLEKKATRISQNMAIYFADSINEKDSMVIQFILYDEFKKAFEVGYNYAIDDMIKFTEEQRNSGSTTIHNVRGQSDRDG